MPALLDIRSMLRSRREERAGDVFDMARRLSRNESVDPDELLSAMTAAGMNDAALADLVDMLTRRAEYRTRAEKLPAAERELASVRDAIKRQREALEEAQSRYRRAVEPLLNQESAVEARVSDATTAQAALMATQNLPAAIVSRIEEARKSLHEADAAVREVQSEIALQKRRADDGLAALRSEGGFDKCAASCDDPQQRPYLRLAVSQAVQDVRGGRHRAAEAAKRLPQLEAARDAAQAAFDAAEATARDF